MRKYEVVPLQKYEYDSSDFIWCVYETASEQIIQSFDFEEDADAYCRFLSQGGAFDGSTPSFILRSVALKEINSTFKETFV